MKLVELLNKANNGYSDGYLSDYYDEKTGDRINGHGDTLSEFIVTELTETFNPESSDEEQINETVRVMEMARRDIDDVIAALLE